MIGQIILDARLDAGVSVVDLARSLDVTENTVYRWQRDEQSPSAAQLALIASELGCRLIFRKKSQDIMKDKQAIDGEPIAAQLRGDEDLFSALHELGEDVYCNGLEWRWNVGGNNGVEIVFHADDLNHITVEATRPRGGPGGLRRER